MLAFWKSGSAGRNALGQNRPGSSPFLQVFVEPPLSPWTNMTSTMGSDASWRRRRPKGPLDTSSSWAAFGCGDFLRGHSVVKACLNPSGLSAVEPLPVLVREAPSGSSPVTGLAGLGDREGPVALAATAFRLSSCGRFEDFRDPSALSSELCLGEDSPMASGSTVQSNYWAKVRGRTWSGEVCCVLKMSPTLHIRPAVMSSPGWWLLSRRRWTPHSLTWRAA